MAEAGKDGEQPACKKMVTVRYRLKTESCEPELATFRRMQALPSHRIVPTEVPKSMRVLQNSTENLDESMVSSDFLSMLVKKQSEEQIHRKVILTEPVLPETEKPRLSKDHQKSRYRLKQQKQR